MNDFTKEELRIIWLSLPAYSYPEIKEKIQSLIDNYCEHESDGFLYTNSDFSNNHPWKCYKCDKYFGDNHD